jgi:hypothetical protein
VIQAFNELDVAIKLEADPKMVVVWDGSLYLFRDSSEEYSYFRKLLPWQVINRIALMNIICRKALLVPTLREFWRRYPVKLDFLPLSYILTDLWERKTFVRAIAREKQIVKPTDGSLGKGIPIIERGQPYHDERIEAVGQTYIESAQLNDRKFDLRVYALLISTKPPTVYVYRNGAARLCSDPVSANTIFSQITNTAVNIARACASITTLKISDVFDRLAEGCGVSVDNLWRSIDQVIARTIVAANDSILKRVSELDEGRCHTLTISS